MAEAKVTRAKLKDLKWLERNPNKGTERGQYFLEKSFSDAGAVGTKSLTISPANPGGASHANYVIDIAAAVGGDELHRHVSPWGGQQHHVAGWAGDRHRRRGRYGHHHDGEHLSARRGRAGAPVRDGGL